MTTCACDTLLSALGARLDAEVRRKPDAERKRAAPSGVRAGRGRSCGLATLARIVRQRGVPAVLAGTAARRVDIGVPTDLPLGARVDPQGLDDRSRVRRKGLPGPPGGGHTRGEPAATPCTRAGRVADRARRPGAAAASSIEETTSLVGAVNRAARGPPLRCGPFGVTAPPRSDDARAWFSLARKLITDQGGGACPRRGCRQAGPSTTPRKHAASAPAAGRASIGGAASWSTSRPCRRTRTAVSDTWAPNQGRLMAISRSPLRSCEAAARTPRLVRTRA